MSTLAGGQRTGKSRSRAERLRMAYRAELDAIRADLMEALAVVGEQLTETRKQVDMLSMIVGDALEGLTPEVMADYAARVDRIHEGMRAANSVVTFLWLTAHGAPDARKRLVELAEERAAAQASAAADAARAAEAERAAAAIMAEHRQAEANADADSAERAAAIQLGAEGAAPLPPGMVRTAGGLVVPE